MLLLREFGEVLKVWRAPFFQQLGLGLFDTLPDTNRRSRSPVPVQTMVESGAGARMTQTLEAIYENGVFRPLSEPAGVPEHTRVTLTVLDTSKPGPPLDLIGSLPHEDAEEMRAIIQREFSRVERD